MPVTTKDAAPWLLLVFSLTKKGATLRVTMWRKLHRFGAVTLGNSGYLIPNTMDNRERFEWLATTIRSEQGEASIVEVKAIDNYSTPQLKQKFIEARDRDYQALLTDVRKVSASSSRSARATRMRQRLQAIAFVGFFNSPIRAKVETAVNALDKRKLDHANSDMGQPSPVAYLHTT